MGRGRGKGKKLTVTSLEDPTTGEEEKISSKKQSGNAEQPLKDEIKEEEFGKVEAIDDHAKTYPGKVIESPNRAETGKKRKRNSSIKEKVDLVNDASCNVSTQTSIVQVKSNGFRHNGSRRKSKPRRAAEAVVECR